MVESACGLEIVGSSVFSGDRDQMQAICGFLHKSLGAPGCGEEVAHV